MPIAVKLGRVWNLLKLMPFSQKFDILLSSIPTYLICVLVVDNPLFYLMSVQFTEKCFMYNLLFQNSVIIQLNYLAKWKLWNLLVWYQLKTIYSSGNCFFVNLSLYLAKCMFLSLVDIITKQDLQWTAS